MPTSPIPIHLHPLHGEVCLCGGNPELDPYPQPECSICSGTGKIGGNAEPVGRIELRRDLPQPGWYWYDFDGGGGGPFHGSDLAATALRAAVLGLALIAESRAHADHLKRERDALEVALGDATDWMFHAQGCDMRPGKSCGCGRNQAWHRARTALAALRDDPA